MSPRGFSAQLNAARVKGVSIGIHAMQAVAIIAAHNTFKDTLPDEQFHDLFWEFEGELARVWNEIVNLGQDKKKLTEEAAELLAGHAERILREMSRAEDTTEK